MSSFSLDGVKYEHGKINVVNKKTGSKPKFYQKKWCVWDFMLVLVAMEINEADKLIFSFFVFSVLISVMSLWNPKMG